MSEQIPERRKAWKVDDPAWVRERESQWRKIKNSPVLKRRLRQREIERVKNYFLTGSAFRPEPEKEEWRYLRYHPDTKPLPTTCNTLLQCWLSAEGVDWEHIRENAHPLILQDSRWYLRDLLKSVYPEQIPLFNGRDRRIYYFFAPTRCRPEDYPELPRDKFYQTAWLVRLELHPAIDQFLSVPYNRDSLAPELVPERCDSIVPAFHHYENLEKAQNFLKEVSKTLTRVAEIIDNQADFEDEIVGFATRMHSRFKEMELPHGMDEIATLLA